MADIRCFSTIHRCTGALFNMTRKWDKLLPAGPARIRRRWARHDTLRGELAAAIVIARRYSRQCDALRQERDQLEREMTALIGPDSDAPLPRDSGGVVYERAGSWQYPYRPATSESFDESDAATMLATEPLLAQDWCASDDSAAWDAPLPDADAPPPSRGAI